MTSSVASARYDIMLSLGGIAIFVFCAVSCGRGQVPPRDCIIVAEGVEDQEEFLELLEGVERPEEHILIGQSVAFCPCDVGRRRDGAVEARIQRGAEDLERRYGGEIEGRHHGGDGDLERLYGGLSEAYRDEARAHQGSGDLERLYGGLSEARAFQGLGDLERLYGGQGESRAHQGLGDLERLYGGLSESRMQEGAGDLERVYGGRIEERRERPKQQSAVADEGKRLLDGAVSKMICTPKVNYQCRFVVSGVVGPMTIFTGGELRQVEDACIP